MQNPQIINNINKSEAESLSLKKQRKRNYAIASGAIFAIIVFHFVFQFSFIQSENFRTVKKLTKTVLFDENEQIAENTVVPEINVAEVEKAKEEINSETRIEYKIKQPAIIQKPQFTPPPVQSRRKTAPSPIVIKRKVPQPETRAEQLRRAEKILTGA
ncbi:MAG: hypothetical protein ACR2J3_04135 [Aridibacter sp.]